MQSPTKNKIKHLATYYSSFSRSGLLVLIFIYILSACTKDEINDPAHQKTEAYSFFVAGHTFGIYYMDNIGLHPPFMEKFTLIDDRNIDIGFLLGDIVVVSNEKNWNEVDSVLQYLDCDIYFAAGNHDVTDRPLYESRYGKTYFSFKHMGDLFIVLDPNIDQWNISGEQFVFLREVLEKESGLVRNIFLFTHQLIWWEKNNKYGNIRLNSHAGKADTTNFWTDIEPLLNALPNEVYMFAGDLGAADWSDDYMYDNYDNITLIATGMGEGVGDNFIFIEVDETGKVGFELIALNGDDIHALGKLEDYILP